MARVTIEDCVCAVPNRFQLAVLAGQRVKQFGRGAVPTVSLDNDKDPVIALREIAYGTISIDALNADLINSFRQTFFEEDFDDVEGDDYDPTSFVIDAQAVQGEADTDDIIEQDADADIDFSSIITEESSED